MRPIDVGVRDVVALLNAIPGVSTRASCEGTDRRRATHRHADLAYVLLHYPLPLAFQDFLVTRLDAVARIEGDGVFSRWPARNREFLSRLTDAVRAYQAAHTERGQCLRLPLAKLRARLARRLIQREATHVRLCPACTEIVMDHSHAETHATVSLLHVPKDQALQWFTEFVARPGNALDRQLIAREGWLEILARTHCGDFGAPFYRRWLRYRSRRLADLTTHELRHGVEAARRQGQRIDFYFDGADAYFGWEHNQIPSRSPSS